MCLFVSIVLFPLCIRLLQGTYSALEASNGGAHLAFSCPVVCSKCVTCCMQAIPMHLETFQNIPFHRFPPFPPGFPRFPPFFPVFPPYFPVFPRISPVFPFFPFSHGCSGTWIPSDSGTQELCRVCVAVQSVCGCAHSPDCWRKAVKQTFALDAWDVQLPLIHIDTILGSSWHWTALNLDPKRLSGVV